MALITPNLPLMVPPVYVSPTAMQPYPILQAPAIRMDPLGPYAVYPDVNSDVDLQTKVTEHFWEKLTEDWVRYFDVFKYLRTSNARVDLIRNPQEYSTEGYSPEKKSYLLQFVITKKDLHYLLDNFCSVNRVNWWDLSKYSSEIREYLERKMRHYLKREVLKVGKH